MVLPVPAIDGAGRTFALPAPAMFRAALAEFGVQPVERLRGLGGEMVGRGGRGPCRRRLRETRGGDAADERGQK
jgi:hypothetical protein